MTGQNLITEGELFMTKFAKFFNGKESKTAAEALQKKKISKIGMICGAGLIVLAFVLIAVLSATTELDAMPIAMPIIVIAVLDIMFFWLKLNCARKELFVLKNHYCDKCGERYTFENASYNKLYDNVITSRDGQYINLNTYTTVTIKCKCAKCNNEHSFNYDFLTKREKTNEAGAKLSEENFSLDDRVYEHLMG